MAIRSEAAQVDFSPVPGKMRVTIGEEETALDSVSFRHESKFKLLEIEILWLTQFFTFQASRHFCNYLKAAKNLFLPGTSGFALYLKSPPGFVMPF